MSDLFFRNRRLLILTVILVVASGAISLMRLPRQEDPTLTPRFGLVLTAYPGATAERVEALVTEKIERELREVEEIKELASTSRAGFSVINVELKDTIDDVDPVWSRVRDRLGDVQAELPTGTSEPELRDKEETDTYTLIAGLQWRGRGDANMAVLRRLAEELRDRMRDVPGTAFVKLFGDPNEEIRIDIDRSAAGRLGLTPGDIAMRIRGSDAKVAAGLVRGARSDLNVEVSGELDSLERIRDLPLDLGASGQMLRLRDVASVEKAIQDPPAELAMLDGERGVAVAARMATQERTDLWAAQMRTALEGFRAELPDAVGLELLFDQSRYVESRLSGLMENFLLGIGLVVLVIFFMMGWRSAIVVGAALPLSTLMVLFGLDVLGVPIQQMSVAGLIIALGLLIDNAIIMVDEVSHRVRDGMSLGRAVRESVRFLAVPLLGSTITTVLAFMPMIVVPGPMGEFVGTMAISVVLALISSLILALTVLPTLVAILRGTGRGGPMWLRNGIGAGPFHKAYRASLGWMARRPKFAMAFAMALPLAGFAVASQLDEQFFPPAERNQVRVEMRLASQTSLEETRRVALAMRDVMHREPLVDEVHWFVGRDAPKFYYNMLGGKEGSSNYAEALVQLTSKEESLAFVRRLQRGLDETFPEAQVLVRALEQGPPFDAPIEMRIFGPDLEKLRRLGDEARAVLATVTDVTHTRASLAGDRPKLKFVLDEEGLSRTGLVNTDVARQLDANLEGVRGGSLLEGTEELPVRVRLTRAAREGAERIESVDLLANATPGANRRPIPLSAVGRTTLEPEDGAITRRDGARVNTIQGFVTAGVLPAVVLTDFETALADAGFEVPAGYRLEFGGEQAERDRAVGYLLGSIVLLMMLMVSTLVVAFRSFRIMGLVLTIGGLSVGLGLLSLWVFDYHFGFMAIVGTMGLVGIAINDSIAVLAGLRADKRIQQGDIDAIPDVVERSTRHVLSTTVTTIAGFLPLILAGGGFWPPLAIAIAGGVAGSSILALYFLPAAYRVLAVREARKRDPEPAPHTAPAPRRPVTVGV